MFEKIAKALSQNSNYSYEACLYILRTYTHLFSSLVLILIIAYLLKILLWSSLIILTYMILRSFSGGAHSKSKIICTIISLIIPIGGGLIVSYLNISDNIILVLSFITISLSIIILLKYAPADTPEKPIISLDFKRKLKRNSIIFVVVLELAIILIYFLSFNYFKEVSLCLLIGLIFQIFSILPFSYFILNYLDSVLTKTGGNKICNNKSINHF